MINLYCIILYCIILFVYIVICILIIVLSFVECMHMICTVCVYCYMYLERKWATNRMSVASSDMYLYTVICMYNNVMYLCREETPRSVASSLNL